MDGRPIHDMEMGNKYLRARMKNKFPLLKWQRLDQEHCKIFVPSLVRPNEVHTYYAQWARKISNGDSALEMQHLMTTL